MALLQCARQLAASSSLWLGAAAPLAAAAPRMHLQAQAYTQQHAWGGAHGSNMCCSSAQQLHTSATAAASQPGADSGAPGPDPFTASLQAKTEQELAQLLQRRAAGLAMQQGEGDDADIEEEEEEEEMVNMVNAETGERGGPRGKEPTRFGDWEQKGRCSDF